MTRVPIAWLVVTACLVVPTATDACATWCERTHAADAAGMTASGPTCHHAPARDVRIGDVPRACGHDHSGTVTTAIPTGNFQMHRLVAAQDRSPASQRATRVAFTFEHQHDFLNPLLPRDTIGSDLSSQLRI